MNDVLYPLAAALAWAALAYRLARGLRRDPGDPALYAVSAVFAILAVIFTVSSPVVWGALDRAVGVPNLALLVSQSGVVAFSATIQCLIFFWTHPRREGWRHARWRIAWAATVLLLMAVLFDLTAAREESVRTAAASYAHDPVYAVYLGVYLAAFTVGVVDISRLCLSYASSTSRPWLSRGLRLTAAGSALGLVYCLLRTATLIAAQTGHDPYRWEFLVPPASALGGILVVLGLSLPALGPHLASAAGWVSRWRAYRSLHPLWNAVRLTTPEVVLSGGERRTAWRRLDHRLHRRIIEIGDGVRAVREHLGEQVACPAAEAAQQAGLTGDKLHAIVYAARLRNAFAARERLRRAAAADSPGERRRRRRWDAWYASLPVAPAPGTAATTGPPALPERGPSRDLAVEVRWLAAVATALSRTPLPAERTPR